MFTIGEKCTLELIPPVELDKLLSRFFMEVVRTTDGVPYQPDVLSMHRGQIKRYKDDKKYGKNILQDPPPPLF